MDLLRDAEALIAARVLGIVRCQEAAEAEAIGLGLAAAGLAAIEVTFTVREATHALRRLTEQLPGALIGAGTILSEKDAERALDAGARFLVSPVLDPGLLERMLGRGVLFIPAGLSPTELQLAARVGAPLQKLFPARQVGPRGVSDILSPLPHLKLLVTGGVSLDGAAEYLRAGAAIVGLGRDLSAQSQDPQRLRARLAELSL